MINMNEGCLEFYLSHPPLKQVMEVLEGKIDDYYGC